MRKRRRIVSILLVGVGALLVAGSAIEAAPKQPHAFASARVRVDPPVPPRSYRVPRDAIVVRSSAGLVRALARSRPTTIVLASGRYSTAGTRSQTPYFHAVAGHRIYARRRGRAVLRAGLVFGGNFAPGGGRVQGLRFDVASQRRAHRTSSALHLWGVTGRGTTILDTTFQGHGVLEAAIRADQVEGLVVRRVVIRRFRRYGLFASDNDRNSTAAATAISDIDVTSVKERPPGTDHGRSEYGVWIGNTVREPVVRIRIRDFGWAGLWTGNNANDLRLAHLDIDGSARAGGNAVYIEHKTRRSVFERFRLGPDIKEGFVSEWDYGTEPTGAGTDIVIQLGVIDTNTRRSRDRVGVFVGDGTERMTIRNVTFLNADEACIVDRGRGTVTESNDYRRRRPGAAVVSSGD